MKKSTFIPLINEIVDLIEVQM